MRTMPLINFIKLIELIFIYSPKKRNVFYIFNNVIVNNLNKKTFTSMANIFFPFHFSAIANVTKA